MARFTTAFYLITAISMVGCIPPNQTQEMNIEQVKADAIQEATAFANKWVVNDYNFLGYTLFEKPVIPITARLVEKEGLTVRTFSDPNSSFKVKLLELNNEGILIGISAFTTYASQEEARNHYSALEQGLRQRFPNLWTNRSENSENGLVWFMPRKAYINGRVSEKVSNAGRPYLAGRNYFHPDDKLQNVMCSCSQRDGNWIVMLNVQTMEREKITSGFKSRQSDAIKEELNKGAAKPEK